jgi:hypothetical protein
MAMMSSAAETFSRHFFGPLSTIKMSGHTQVDEPLRYSPKLQRAGRDTGTRRQAFFSHHLMEKYLPLSYLEFVSLVSHPPDGRQGRQEGVLLQPALVWSGKKCALHENP